MDDFTINETTHKEAYSCLVAFLLMSTVSDLSLSVINQLNPFSSMASHSPHLQTDYRTLVQQLYKEKNLFNGNSERTIKNNVKEIK